MGHTKVQHAKQLAKQLVRPAYMTRTWAIKTILAAWDRGDDQTRPRPGSLIQTPEDGGGYDLQIGEAFEVLREGVQK